MRILLVTPYFYPKTGGLENYAYRIAKGLVKRGFEITVLCSHDKRDMKTKLEVIDGIKVIRLGLDFKISNTPVKINLFNVIYNIIKENEFELVNAHTPVPFYADVSAMVCRKLKLPFVLTYHNDNVKENFPMNFAAEAYNYSFNIATLKSSDCIITPSLYCYKESKFLRMFADKVVHIPPGIEVEKYSAKRSFRLQDDFNIPCDAKIVMFVGNMGKEHRHKGVDYLIKAFRMVKEIIKNAYLVLVGSGSLIPEYKKLCARLKMADSVIFTGFVSDDVLIEYYRGSDVIVLPSVTAQEGFGMVLIEANACGKPVIGSKVGGIKYVIKNGKNGFFVPPRDSELLANAIVKLLSDENLAKKMGKIGRKMVENEYNITKSLRNTEKIYKKVTCQ